MIDEIKMETGENDQDVSLVFGTWLTPDLYVSYGKDLIKESGLFATRFNLGKGFSLTTETGASQSGGDIKYEFEHWAEKLPSKNENLLRMQTGLPFCQLYATLPAV